MEFVLDALATCRWARLKALASLEGLVRALCKDIKIAKTMLSDMAGDLLSFVFFQLFTQ